MDAPQHLDINVSAFPYEQLSIEVLKTLQLIRETQSPAIRDRSDLLHLRFITWLVNALHIPELPA